MATVKQKILAKELAKGKKLREASKTAGLNESYASRVRNCKSFKTVMEKLMDKVGLSDAKVFQAHAELIAANKTVSVIPVKGETEGRDATASSVEFVDVPDWMARAKGIDMAHRIKSRYVEKKEVSGPDGGAIPVQFTVKFVGE